MILKIGDVKHIARLRRFVVDGNFNLIPSLHPEVPEGVTTI